MKWGFLTLAAVLLVSCVSVTDGLAQVVSLNPTEQEKELAKLCRWGTGTQREQACARLERARSSRGGTSLEAGVKEWRVTPEGEFVCGVGTPICDAVEGAAEKVDAVKESVGGTVDAAKDLVGGALGLVGGALGTLGGVADTVTETVTEMVGTGTSAEAPRPRAPGNPSQPVEDLRNEASRPLPRGVDRERFRAELKAQLALIEDTNRKLEEAKADWSVAAEEANTTHQEHLALAGEIERDTLLREAQQNERDTGIDYARSRRRTAERNIEYAEKEYRAASQDYGRVATSYPSAGGGGTGETVLRTLSGTGSSGGGGLLGRLSGGGGATGGFDGAASMSSGGRLPEGCEEEKRRLSRKMRNADFAGMSQAEIREEHARVVEEVRRFQSRCEPSR